MLLIVFVDIGCIEIRYRQNGLDISLVSLKLRSCSPTPPGQPGTLPLFFKKDSVAPVELTRMVEILQITSNVLQKYY